MHTLPLHELHATSLNNGTVQYKHSINPHHLLHHISPLLPTAPPPFFPPTLPLTTCPFPTTSPSAVSSFHKSPIVTRCTGSMEYCMLYRFFL